MEDFAILGSGPAGLAAAQFIARAGHSPLVLEGPSPGGQIVSLPRLENVPGFPDGIEGFELADRYRRGAELAGARFSPATVLSLSPRAPAGADLSLSDGTTLSAARVVVATGIRPRPAGLPNEEALVGRGVSYCVPCDGPLYRGQDVLLLGDGPSALGAASQLSRLVRRVTFLCLAPALPEAALERAAKLGNVSILLDAKPEAFETGADGTMTGVRLADGTVLPSPALFVSRGATPATAFAPALPRDARGYLADAAALPPGVFAAGDVATPALHQVAVAAASG
ncbi:MAG: FAD-dependent oxidoreductase, partial [Kiritimatiellae bacterium]|nr:FAD-dependent oxidoreductase [Kiritimatiellia bacterium]